MKKILFFLVLLIIYLSFTFSFTFSFVDASCNYDGKGSIGEALENCLSGTKLVGTDSKNSLKVDDKGFQEKLTEWRNSLAIYLGIAAVFGLVFASFVLVTSNGTEEKVTKAKSIVKWVVLGFLVIILAPTVIILVINLFYSI